MSQMQWSFVTVSYGNSLQISSLYASFLKFAPKNWEWIIIDNNSPNNDIKILQEFFVKQSDKRVHIIPQAKNIGFSAANNQAVSWAKGEYIVSLNPDIQLTEPCFGALEKAIKNEKKAGIVVPQLRDENKKNHDNTRSFPRLPSLIWRRLWRKTEKKKNNTKSIMPVCWAQGSFMIIKRQFFRENLGGFDERFFLFLEDVDLCRRCWELGYRVLLVHQVFAQHSRHRLSGGNIFTAVFKKVFWLHLASTAKYFIKYFKKKPPNIF